MASLITFSVLLTVLLVINLSDAKKVWKEVEVDQDGDIVSADDGAEPVGANPKRKKKASQLTSNDEDEDDLTFHPPESTGRKDCIDDDELEDCSDECNDNQECRRQKHNFECEEHCEQLCKYLEMNIATKCVINLTGGLAEYRFGRVHSPRGGSRRRRRR